MSIRSILAKLPKYPKLLVIGNESMDIDSFASSVLFSLYSTTSTTPATPFINIPRADLALRPEIALIMKQLDIPVDNMLFADDRTDLSAMKWILVDHNQLTGPLAAYNGNIVGIIDHHVIENEAITKMQLDPYLIDQSGSCCSLVTKYISKAIDAHMDPSAQQQLAQLALAPIIIDTSNLQNRVTHYDTEAFEYWTAKLQGFDAASWYAVLHTEKANVSGFTTAELLRRDYKQWTSESGLKLGFSSSVKSLQWLHEHAKSQNQDFDTEWKKYAAEKNLDLSFILCSYQKDVQCRQLCLYIRTTTGSEDTNKFVAALKKEFNLEPWIDSDQPNIYKWNQRSPANRKAIAPFVRTSL
ncbi:hypothetical protein CANCADRAFT_57753 [Tortispora caseinolytica NRRL Y-17796]|uniref:DHHA2 domain-containing protein n=1 Tax=Tortispora caseinolytica NRRL Y-17796 TaxID=767744 RepID=A0A1E4TA16_9ASCO|nr:hypothetical protein CANCADRAFT_57753 [Tortispora caseinolytica NRRL Y-17796]